MNKENIFNTKIEYIKGVGPKRASVLNKELGVFTFSDVLKRFPFRYEDRTVFLKIKEITNSTGGVNFVGKVVSIKKLGYKKNKRLVVKIQDNTGSVELVWFKGIIWIEKKIKVGLVYVVF